MSLGLCYIKSVEFLESLWQFILISAPYLMLGLFISGIVHQYLSVDTIKNQLGTKGMSSVFKASAIGVPLPLCSCSVIPASVTLKKNGATNGATSAFLISTPESGIDSIAMTYGLMDLPLTILRPIAAFFSASIAGFFQNQFNNTEYKEEKSVGCCHVHDHDHDHDHGSSSNSKFLSALEYGFVTLLKDIAVWLAFGILLGAMINYFVPENLFYELSATQGRLIILAIGIPFYICASATTPIAASLILKGMSPGTALLLLLVGPATNVSNIVVMQKYLGKKGVVINLLAIIFVALGFSYLTDFLYQSFSWESFMKLQEGHNHEHNDLFIVIISVAFLLLLGNALFLELKSKLNSKK